MTPGMVNNSFHKIEWNPPLDSASVGFQELKLAEAMRQSEVYVP